MLRIFTTMLLTFFTCAAFAHPGHDHDHWTSNTIHFILALALLGVVAVGVYVYRRKKFAKQGEK